MFSIYAKTRDGQILKGSSNADNAASALEEAHKTAKNNGLEIVKATVKFLENKSAFSVSAGKVKGTPKSASKPAGKR